MGWLAAILSGLLAGLAYPTRFGDLFLPNLGFFGFFCWVPLMMVVAGQSVKRAFGLSFVAGLVHFGVSQYWLYSAIHNFGGLSSTVSALVLILLVLILSAFFGAIFGISQWISRCFGWSTLWLRPMVWVSLEYLRHFWPAGGYPWSQLGYTQDAFLPFLQSAELWGVDGITFLLVLSNEVLFRILLSLWQRKLHFRWKTLTPAVLLILANGVYGYYRLANFEAKPFTTLKVGVVQGNIPQEEKWDRGHAKKIFQIFMEGTRQLEAQGAQLILWPEAALPLTVPYDAESLPLPLGNQQADVLLGSITRPKRGQGAFTKRTVHNSALLLDSDKKILDYYHKKELVPFGEYVPYQEVLFFAKRLTAGVGNLQPGEAFRPMTYGKDRLGVLICYEDIFPYIAREMVDQGANTLINITNDAWYGFSSAAYQHQVYSQLRAIETRRSLIRATNTGVSSLIAPTGKILWQGGLYTREDFLSDLPLYQGKTFFVKYGYHLSQIFLIMTGILVIGAFFKRSKA